jgi:hypothetical protein
MAPLLSLEQYEARAGRSFTGLKKAQVEAYLDDASAIVRRIAATSDEDETDLDDVDHTDVPDLIKPIVTSMVNRGLANPRGLTSERIGDYAYTAAGQAIYATAEEERLILAAVDRSLIGHITLEGDMPERLLLEADIAPFPVNISGD